MGTKSMTFIILICMLVALIPGTASAADTKFTIGSSDVTASGDDGNVPANTVDGDFLTRWSANGDMQWIQYDLGVNRKLSFIKIAFLNGSSRTSTFDILTSMDGSTFTTVSSGVVSSLVEGLQTFDFPDVDSTRYVRIVGHGNSSNLWNSYSEVELYGTANGSPPGASKLAITLPQLMASGDDGNIVAYTIDGDLNTRWSASGEGEWIQYDLGSSKRVEYVKIAFTNGAERTFAFDIQTSYDGYNFSTVLSGAVSSLSNSLQTFDFADVAPSATFVLLAMATR